MLPHLDAGYASAHHTIFMALVWRDIAVGVIPLHIYGTRMAGILQCDMDRHCLIAA